MSGSRAENGSSRNQSSGPTASERAMPTRCCCPAGKLARVVALAPVEAHELDHLPGAGLARAPVDALHLEGKGHVLQHRTVGQQREVLKHHAHLVAAKLRELPVGRLEQVLPLEHDCAGGGLDQAGKAAEQRGLAGAREPHDHEYLAGIDLQRGVAHGGDVAFFQNGGEIGRAPVPVHERPGLGAEQLPDAAARENGFGQHAPPCRAEACVAAPLGQPASPSSAVRGRTALCPYYVPAGARNKARAPPQGDGRRPRRQRALG